MTNLDLKKGVVYGDDLNTLLKHAKDNNYAIPAVNVTTSSSIIACLETAKKINSPIIIQFSNGGGHFFGGKGFDNKDFKASIIGTIAGAKYVHELARLYEVSIVLHTDHCNKENLPWLDGVIKEGEAFYNKNNAPLFSSHMLDLSAESMDYNLEMSQKYLTKISKMDMHLEIELGITGGEEDGVDNENVDEEHLYTQPEEVYRAYELLSKISKNFTIAASFGNVHGVYKPGNVHLRPEILDNSQKYLVQRNSLEYSKPLNFVFHGGSGSDKAKIQESLNYGVIKMNLDTDFQWAYWDGVKNYIEQNSDYLQTQLGNPEGGDKPNKKYYDPRKWLRSGELSFIKRLEEAYNDLNCVGVLN